MTGKREREQDRKNLVRYLNHMVVLVNTMKVLWFSFPPQ